MAYAASYRSRGATVRRRAQLRARFSEIIREELAQTTAAKASEKGANGQEEPANHFARAAAAAAAAKDRVIACGVARWGRILDRLVEDWFRDWSRNQIQNQGRVRGLSRATPPSGGDREEGGQDDNEGYTSREKRRSFPGDYSRKSGAAIAGKKRSSFTEVKDHSRRTQRCSEAARLAKERAFRAAYRTATPIERERLKQGFAARYGISIFSRNKTDDLRGSK